MYLPKVSLQIPTYNQGNLVSMAIESCLAQTYSNIEIIIADDASQDNTRETIQKYLSHPNVKYYRNEINIGRVANYKKALYQYTTGEWVLNLDGDDYFININFIKNAVESIEKVGPVNVLFYHGVHILSLKELKNAVLPQVHTIVFTGKNYLNSFFSTRFSHLSILYNRQCAIKEGFYDLDIVSTDIYSILNLALKNPDKKLIISTDVSGIWLQHDNNVSKSTNLLNHLKNFYLYLKLFYKQLVSPYFSFISSFTWLWTAFHNYWGDWYIKKFRHVPK